MELFYIPKTSTHHTLPEASLKHKYNPDCMLQARSEEELWCERSRRRVLHAIIAEWTQLGGGKSKEVLWNDLLVPQLVVQKS